MTLTDELQNAPDFDKLAASHPLRARMLLAIASRIDAAVKHISNGNLREFAQVSAEIGELGGWLDATSGLPSQSQIENSFSANLAAQWPLTLAFEYRDLQRKRPVGHPKESRHLALQALEMRGTNPDQSWMQVAILLCRCGGPHDYRCKERIRQQTLVLKKTLAALGV